MEPIATTSVGEGLDFACSLASSAITRVGDANPQSRGELLSALTAYIQFRYVGEDELALEQLCWLGHRCAPAEFRSQQFWSQLKWVATTMDLAGDDLTRLELPD